MENRLKTASPAPSLREPPVTEPGGELALGRLPGGDPIAVIDIGSNSVRLVVYERLSRSPTVLFNEKVLCGLGRGMAGSNRLMDEAVACALAALERFRMLTAQTGVEQIKVLATAAAREAENGADFIARAEAICGVPIEVLTGKEEAKFAALGVASGFHRPDGTVGDLGGGSLELVDLTGARVGTGVTLPLGGLRLQEVSGDSVAKARKIAAAEMREVALLDRGRKRTFYAIGGTWRSLARLHMHETGYPLKVMHNYRIKPGECVDFCRAVARRDPDALAPSGTISKARQPLLAYGATVLSEIVERAQPSEILLSALGLREGLLYDLLDLKERGQDPLLAAAEELALLRSRSPLHARELGEWTGALMDVVGVDETDEEIRLRTAACLLADIGWRAHPDYRGEQSHNIIAHAAFVGIDHPGRAFLALSVMMGHIGDVEGDFGQRLRELLSTRLMERARILGAALRVAYLVSASMPGVMLKTHFSLNGKNLRLHLPGELAGLEGERLAKRLAQLGKLVGYEATILAEPDVV